MGLRVGALGLKTMFVRIPATPGDRGVVASRGHFPASLGARSARRRAGSAESPSPAGTGSAGAAALASAGCGCATAAARSPRSCSSPPIARPCCGRSCGWPKRSARRSQARLDPALVTLLTINGWLLAWRILMRACFTASAYGLAPGPAVRSRAWSSATSSPCSPLARAIAVHAGGGAKRWDKTRHIFPPELAAHERRRSASSPSPWSAGPGCASATLGMLPGAEALHLADRSGSCDDWRCTAGAPAIVPTEFAPIDPPLAPPPGQPGYPAIRGYAGPTGSAHSNLLLSGERSAAGARLRLRRFRRRARPQLAPIAPMPPSDILLRRSRSWMNGRLSRIASAAMPARRSATAPSQQSIAPDLCPGSARSDAAHRLGIAARAEPAPGDRWPAAERSAEARPVRRFAYNFTRQIGCVAAHQRTGRRAAAERSRWASG